MAETLTQPNQLLFLESFSQRVEYPERQEGQFYEIFWIKDFLESSLQLDEDELKNQQWLYLVAPLQGRKLKLKGTSGIFLRFHKGLLNLEIEDFSLEVFRLFHKPDDFIKISIPEEELATLGDLIHIMRRELDRDRHNFLFLRSLLKSFLLKIISLSQEDLRLPDVNAKRVYKFLNLMEKHYKETRNSEFYADKLNLSSNRLNQILKERMGRTMSELLQERMIMEAKRQLYEGKRNIKEIGFDLGFSDQAYFSRVFRRMTGKSPEGFRKDITARL